MVPLLSGTCLCLTSFEFELDIPNGSILGSRCRLSLAALWAAAILVCLLFFFHDDLLHVFIDDLYQVRGRPFQEGNTLRNTLSYIRCEDSFQTSDSEPI